MSADDVFVSAEYQAACRLGLVEVRDVRIGPSHEALLQEIGEFCRRRRKFYGECEVSEIPGIVQARALFRSLGIDPAEIRPCSEIFLKRLLRGGEFPRICNLVDLTNYCSAEAAAPVCVYDLGQFLPPLEFRRGREGESWESMRGAVTPVNGLPILADSRGPFGGPFADSRRTRITPATCQALIVWFVSLNVSPRALQSDLETLSERLACHQLGHPAVKWNAP